MDRLQNQLDKLTIEKPTDNPPKPQTVVNESISAKNKRLYAESYFDNIRMYTKIASTEQSLLQMKCSEISMRLDVDDYFSAHTERFNTKKRVYAHLAEANKVLLEAATNITDPKYSAALEKIRAEIETISDYTAQIWQIYQNRLSEKLLDKDRDQQERAEELAGDEIGDEEFEMDEVALEIEEMEICD